MNKVLARKCTKAINRVGSGLTCLLCGGSGRVGSCQLKVTHVQLCTQVPAPMTLAN